MTAGVGMSAKGPAERRRPAGWPVAVPAPRACAHTLTEIISIELDSSALQSSAFAPALFSGGEGGRRPDEGAHHRTVLVPNNLSFSRDCSSSSYSTPPSSAFGTFSPRKKRGGRRRSIGGFRESCKIERDHAPEFRS